MLEKSPVAVEIRLAETAAMALAKGGNSLVIAPDANASTLLQLVGAGTRLDPKALAAGRGLKK